MTEREEPPIPPAAATTGPMRTSKLLAGMGLGVVLMYFLDPKRGARRRGLVRDKLARLLRVGDRELFQAAAATTAADNTRAERADLQ